MNIAIVKAGGTGQRIKGKNISLPKQFIEVEGKPLLIYSIEPLQKANNIDKIIISCHENYIDLAEKYCKKFNITKLLKIVKGGETTRDSFLNGLKVAKNLMNDDDLIIMADAVRPLVSTTTVEEIVNKAKEYGAAGGMVKIAECAFTCDEEDKISYIGNDASYMSKTPQAIKLGYLEKYNKQAIEMNVYEKCPALCTLCINTNNPYAIVKDSPYNIKITYQNQLEFFEMIVKNGLREKIMNIK